MQARPPPAPLEPDATFRRERLLRTAVRRLGRHEDAEDAVQEAMLRLFHYPHDPARASASTWTFRSLQHAVVDLARRRASHARRQAAHLDDGEGADTRVDERIEAHRAVERILAAAEGNERQLVALLMAGWAPSEIAQAEGRSHGAVRSQICRLRARLAGDVRL